MAYTFDVNLFSDLYKEVYGHRPSVAKSEEWNSMTDDKKQEEWDTLCEFHANEIEREREEKNYAVKNFNSQIDELISMGAGDRNTAIRWLVDSMELDKKDIEFYGAEIICYQTGIPYEMQSEINEAITL